jgi:probable HAF family extracellular repeat protein
MGINASGHVGGSSTTSPTTPDFAFLYRAGKMTNLGTLGGVASFAYAINDSDLVTGFTYLPGNLYAPAFLYTPGKGMVDVNTLTPSNSGWTLDYGFAINDAGQITGRGENHALGQQDAFLLTPISIDFLIHLVRIDSLRPATRGILIETLEEAKGARHTRERCRGLSIFEQEVDWLHGSSMASQLVTEIKLVKAAQGCE